MPRSGGANKKDFIKHALQDLAILRPFFSNRI
jgi:hypothetical protein